MEEKGEVLRQTASCAFFARAWAVHEPQEPPGVVLDPSAEDPFHRQGGWLDAAVKGASIGMQMASASGRFRITRVQGVVVDTNPVLIAVATIRAVWAAYSYEPKKEQTVRLEELVSRSWHLNAEQLDMNLQAQL